jgi:hypothetical protein
VAGKKLRLPIPHRRSPAPDCRGCGLVSEPSRVWSFASGPRSGSCCRLSSTVLNLYQKKSIKVIGNSRNLTSEHANEMKSQTGDAEFALSFHGGARRFTFLILGVYFRVRHFPLLLPRPILESCAKCDIRPSLPASFGWCSICLRIQDSFEKTYTALLVNGCLDFMGRARSEQANVALPLFLDESGLAE